LASKQECQKDWHPSKDYWIDWYPFGIAGITLSYTLYQLVIGFQTRMSE